MPEEPQELSTDTLLGAFGGWKGVVDGSLASTVFVAARFVVDLEAAVIVAVVAGVLVVLLRRVQGESLQQAFSGFFGLLVAVLVVRSTGTGKGIFLPGIFITAGAGVLFGLSLLFRQPVIALGLAAADPRYGAWRTYPPLRRACSVATAAWCASFFVRAGVAGTVYLTYGDSPGDNLLLLVVINAVKWPLIIGCALLSVGLVKQAGLPAVPEVATEPG